MVKHLIRYLIILLLLTATIIFFSFLIFKSNNHLFFPFYPYLIGVFFIITLITHIILVSSAGHSKVFTRRFMLLLTIKIFVLLLVVVIYKLTNDYNRTGFLFSFIILYILYQTFEIISIVRYIKK